MLSELERKMQDRMVQHRVDMEDLRKQVAKLEDRFRDNFQIPAYHYTNAELVPSIIATGLRPKEILPEQVQNQLSFLPISSHDQFLWMTLLDYAKPSSVPSWMYSHIQGRNRGNPARVKIDQRQLKKVKSFRKGSVNWMIELQWRLCPAVSLPNSWLDIQIGHLDSDEWISVNWRK